MLSFFGDHFLYIPVIGAATFMVVVMGASIEEALRRR